LDSDFDLIGKHTKLKTWKSWFWLY
jgi:hypothetical protein